MRRGVAHTLPPGTPCPNCATPLRGGWCHHCGQKAEKYDRSILSLIAEALGDLTELDGRAWRTFRRLILSPGRLTRDYLDGHRAPQVPPFRIFLAVLILVFVTGAWNFEANRVQFKFAPERGGAPGQATQNDFRQARAQLQRWPGGHRLADRAERAARDPKVLFDSMQKWAQQFAILLLPLAALLLSVLFAFRKGVYVFDHLIFAMHSLSFQGLLISVTFLLGLATPWAFLLLVAAPAHLFAHMRGTYRTSIVGTLIRMALLFLGTAYGFGLLMLALMLVGLATVK
jgi:hypothetical protein